MRMRIALLEEDAHDADLIGGWLRSAGCVPVLHGSSKDFLADLERKTYDLLIVGGSTPGAGSMDSLHVCSWVREHLPASVWLLCISAQGGEQDIVAALKAGADDCMVKPVRRAEFLARIEARGRRMWRLSKRPEMFRFGDLSVDLENRVILRDGQRVALTPKSYDLAVFLFSNLGQLLSRSYLMERIWGRGSGTSTRTLDTHISRLRTVLGLTPEFGWQLQSVYQHGYRLDRLDAGAANTHGAAAKPLSCEPALT